ncbi:MAG: hypothetical protein J0M02_06005 [Planctomycetes bacterium]|nr:hypothetical protein [Planctomycetota bacterium]
MNRIVAFSMLQPGMVLAEAASIDGQVLLAAGTTLTSAHIAMLGKRGVRSLAVRQQPATATLPARVILELDKQLRAKFVRADLQHPVVKEVYRLALTRRVHQTMRKGAADAR